MVGDVGQHVTQVCLGVDTAQLAGADQGVHRRGAVALAAAVTNAQGVPYGALHLSGSSNAWTGEEYAAKFVPHLPRAIAQFERRNPPE